MEFDPRPYVNDDRRWNEISKLERQVTELRRQIKELNAQIPRWIPVSERLPEPSNAGRFSETVSVTWQADYGDRFTKTDQYDHVDCAWHINKSGVIAWQYLPKPYEPKEAGDGSNDKR